MIYVVRQAYPTHPAASDVPDLDALYGAERPAGPGGRPWVGINMITSLDGSIAVNGRSTPLGNDSDRAVFAALRRAADVVIVGAATAAAEHYGPPQREGLRIGVVTRQGVDTSTPLFTSGAGFVITTKDGARVPANIDVIRVGFLDIDVLTLIRYLGDIMPPPKFVLAEGGPRLNAALVDAGCVDEMNITIAPRIVGGTGSRAIVGAASTRMNYDLAHTLVDDDGYQFSRWTRR